MSTATYVERRLFLVTAPVDEPITLDEAKWQTKKEDTAEDEWLETLVIPSTRERCEHATWRQLISATFDLKLGDFPCAREIELPRPPLQTVTSITYLDTSGVSQTFAASNYRVSAPTGPRCARGRVALVTGASWPVTATEIDAVTVRFVAGYGLTGAAVPARLKMAMLSDLSTIYLHREDIIAGRIVTMTDRIAGIYRTFKSRESP